MEEREFLFKRTGPPTWQPDIIDARRSTNETSLPPREQGKKAVLEAYDKVPLVTFVEKRQLQYNSVILVFSVILLSYPGLLYSILC